MKKRRRLLAELSGCPRGKAGKRGEVNNVGINKYSERARGRERERLKNGVSKREREREREDGMGGFKNRVREANGFANKQASTALLQIAIELKYTG